MLSQARERQDWAELERGLGTDECKALLERLRDGEPFMRQFSTWSDVIAFMRKGPSRDEAKNEVLRLILERHAADRDPIWRQVLIVAFMPGLLSLHRRHRHWDPEQPDELRQRILAAFLDVVLRFDVTRRADSIAQRLYCGTLHRVYEEYQRTWRRSSRERPLTDLELEMFGEDPTSGIESAIDLRAEWAQGMACLRGHRDADRISEREFVLGVGCLVYHRPIAEVAREMGINYELAKKTAQRLRARLRRLGSDAA